MLVVGGAGLDTLVFLDADRIELDRDSGFSRNVDVVGHMGAYCARGMAGLGRATGFLGSLGQDPAGEQVLRALRGAGATPFIFTDPAGTARSVNLVTRDGSRRAFYDGRGAMDLQVPAELARQALQGVGLAHFSLVNWSRSLLAPARAAGAVVSVDLQDADSHDDPYRADYVAAADIVFVSAAHLSDPVATATGLMARGPAQVVVVGMGPEGVLTVERGAADGAAAPDAAVVPGTGPGHTASVPPPDRLQVHHHPVPGLDWTIVDTNGAGDGLAVGFLDAYVLDGLDVDRAVLRGQIVARWTCTQVGGDDPLDRVRLAAAEARCLDRHGD